MIVRAPRPTSHFTLIRNDVARDSRLSWKARGLLVSMLSYPDSWRFRVEDLIKAGPDGRHAVTTGLTELEDAGYLDRRRRRNPDGTFTTTLWLYDIPNGNRGDTPPHGTPNGDNTVDNPVDPFPSTSDYPSRITGQSLEDCVMKNVLMGNGLTRERTPHLCTRCRGSGKLVHHGTELDTCHQCGGEGLTR